MTWTRGKLKTLVDSARGKNPCPTAKKFIEELDAEFDRGIPYRKKKKQGFLDWLFGEE